VRSRAIVIQGVHSTGKPGKVREFKQTGKNLEKSRNFEGKIEKSGISRKIKNIFMFFLAGDPPSLSVMGAISGIVSA